MIMHAAIQHIGEAIISPFIVGAIIALFNYLTEESDDD